MVDQTRKAYHIRTRERLRTSNILHRMIQHFNGEIELTATQVQVGNILLKKFVPDLKPITVDTGTDTNAKSITNAKLFSIIEGEAERVDTKEATG